MSSERIYQIGINVFGHQVSFSPVNELICQFKPIKKNTTIPLSQIRSVKLSPFVGNVHIAICYLNQDGKEKKYVMTCPAIDEDSSAFIAQLKEKAKGIVWENRFQANYHSNTFQKCTYPLTTVINFLLKKNYVSRPLFLVFWAIMSLGILPLPFFLYFLITGGYQVHTNYEGLTVKKVKIKFFSWEQINRIEVQQLDVHHRTYGVTASILRWMIFVIHSPSIKKPCQFSMKALDASKFMRELVARKKIGEDFLATLVI